jgi:hypothetical protein
MSNLAYAAAERQSNVISFPINTAYMQRLSLRFTPRQLATLKVLMTRSALLHDILEDLYQQAVVVLEEEQVEDEMDRWSFDAIFNQYDEVA